MPCTKARADLCIDEELRRRLIELCRPEPLGTCLRRALEEMARDERVFAMLLHGGEARRIIETYAQTIVQALVSALGSAISQIQPSTPATININIESIVKSVANEIKESVIQQLHSMNIGTVRISLTSTERLRLRQLLLDLSHTLTYLASQIDSNPDTIYRILENKLVKDLTREVRAIERRTKSDISRLAEMLRGTEDEGLARAVAQLYTTLQLIQDLVKIPTAEERRKQLQQLKRQLAITAQIIKELN